MTPERWQQINQLFHSALAYEGGQRAAFLARACAGNEGLRKEVESLVASHEQAASFIETPAADVAAELFAGAQTRLAAGQQIGHYTIMAALGAGGMGEVYLAQDNKLDRQVAVKILNEKLIQRESNVSRFIQEAKAASALNHPNILTIYEFGETEDAHFIVSEFIEGKTLREIVRESKLSLSEILDIASQLAGALSAAHQAQLIHRDIKPENVMIRPDGYVKILDFGLAKLIQPKQAMVGLEVATAQQNETAKGVIMGTVNYMSPEQAKGERVDKRTDIFSLGVVLYEMLAGRTPFAGASLSETFANLINQEPQPLVRFAANVPDELQRIVAKLLRKNKDERYQTMQDVLTDLKGLRDNLSGEEKLARAAAPENEHATALLQATTGAVNKQTAQTQSSFSQTIIRHKPLAAFALIALLIGSIALVYWFYSPSNTAVGDRRSIAVLPLKPIATANRDEIYEVGIADSLIYKLSAMKGIIVRPLSATRKYADIAQDPLAAGREQQVDYVLASNYQLAGGKIRVTAQLFNVASGQSEETYKSEKDTGDVFALEDAIAGEVGNILQARFVTTSGSPTAKRGTTNEEAYRLYLQGMYLSNQINMPDARKAVEVLEQAVRLDPNYAQAWAGLAHAHRAVANLGRSVDIHAEYQKSIEAINKALALDAGSADAYSTLCENKMYYEYDFAGAETACQRAVELNPDSSQAHQIYARLLLGRGRSDEAIAEIKTAIDIEPASLFNQRLYGNCLYNARRYEEAIAQFKRVIATNEDFGTTYMWLSNTLALSGKEAEAFEVWMKSLAVQKADEETVHAFQTAFQTSGWQGVLRERAHRFEKSNEAFFHGAAYNAQIGNKDKAFELLEKSYQRRELWMTILQVDPRFDSLHDDPRFNELVRRVESK